MKELILRFLLSLKVIFLINNFYNIISIIFKVVFLFNNNLKNNKYIH